MLRFPVSDKSSVDLEGGYAQGFSADEGLDDSNDGAFLWGLELICGSIKWTVLPQWYAVA